MTARSTNKTSALKFTLELTDKEVFVIMCALYDFRDIDDSDFENHVKAAQRLLKKLPKTDLEFEDI